MDQRDHDDHIAETLSDETCDRTWSCHRSLSQAISFKIGTLPSGPKGPRHDAACVRGIPVGLALNNRAAAWNDDAMSKVRVGPESVLVASDYLRPT
jgi:hypothetical protein